MKRRDGPTIQFGNASKLTRGVDADAPCEWRVLNPGVSYHINSDQIRNDKQQGYANSSENLSRYKIFLKQHATSLGASMPIPVGNLTPRHLFTKEGTFYQKRTLSVLDFL